VAYDHLLVAREGPIVTVTLNRPKARNALNPAMIGELLDCCAQLRAAAVPRCLILTGAGDRAFVAGADIGALAAMSPQEARTFAQRGQRLMRTLEELPFPVIAAVNGFALGGGLELALACDIILASESAQFGQPEINLGIIPGFGGTQRLTRRVGAAAARWLIYSGETIDAAHAYRLGVVHRVVAALVLMQEAQAVAATLASKAPVALQQAKAAINMALEVDLDDGCRYEAEAFAVACATEDRGEGMRAFLEKRPAVFRGR
jgi:enoyl-CoA hydratase